MTRILLLVALLASAAGAVAETMTEAMSAYRAGEYANAARLLEPWAEQGVVQAQYTLGTLYAFGQGMAPDPSRAVRWLRAAAEQGHLEAARALGNIYVSGLGVPRDEAEAVKWFNKVAELADDSSSDCD